MSLDRVAFAALTPELFHTKYRSKSRPFIITGAFEGVEDWTLEAIERLLGPGEFGVRVYGKDYRTRPKREWKKYSDRRRLASCCASGTGGPPAVRSSSPARRRRLSRMVLASMRVAFIRHR